MIWIGVDPGMAGAIAVVPDAGEPTVHPMPTTHADSTTRRVRRYDYPRVADILRPFSGGPGPSVVLVVIERLTGAPREATNFAGVQSAAGWMLFAGMCTMGRLPWVTVSPQRWQAEMLGPTPRGGTWHERRAAKKAASVAAARRLYPLVDLHATERSRSYSDGMAEALLIAEWGRTVQSGGELFAAAGRLHTPATRDVFA